MNCMFGGFLQFCGWRWGGGNIGKLAFTFEPKVCIMSNITVFREGRYEQNKRYDSWQSV